MLLLRTDRRKAVKALIAREDGALTVFGLYILLAVITISAIAVDVAALMAARNQLQVAADSAAHAALYYRELHTADESKQKAIEVAQFGMPTSYYGDVIETTDITFGYWDYGTQKFTPDPDSTDAVLVNTSRLQEKSNSVASYLFKFVGYTNWDVSTPSVFVQFYESCLREGLVAEAPVDLQSNNGYSNGFCVHSNTHVEMNSNNTYEPGTVVSMPDSSDIVLPRSGYETNDGLKAALRSGVYRLRIINRIDRIIQNLRTGTKTTTGDGVPDFISNTFPLSLTGKKIDETALTKKRIHIWDCAGGSGGTINSVNKIEEVVIVANCAIKFGAGTILEDVIIATTSTSAKSISAPSGLQVGRNDNCAEGGGSVIVTKGSMDFAADLQLYGGQLLAEHDISFSANADGIMGASMVAGGRIDGTSNMQMGFCGTGMENNFEVPYFRLAY